MQYSPLTARLASFVFFSATFAALTVAIPDTRAADGDRGPLRVAPGRVQFAMAANGEWKSFGVRGERFLLNKGGIVVYATRADGTLEERAKSWGGGMRALLAADAIAPVSEGVRGGTRHPSLQPDDDNDGKIDEDVLDRIDNDGDGEVDEDFAAIGDEMVVAMYGTRGNNAVVVRQECYGWSLPHIDNMVASTIHVRNAGAQPIAGARIGFEIEGASELEFEIAPRIETSRRGDRDDTGLVEERAVLRDRDRGLAILLYAPRVAAPPATVADDGPAAEPVPVATSWEIRDDRSRVLAISPFVGDLAPGQTVTLYVALLSLPADDLKAARAIHAARRTIRGDGTSRFIPPPVSVTTRAVGSFERAGDEGAAQAALDEKGLDPFWSTPGKLEERLVVGSPNPFRDQIAIDYEVPSRVVDEDGVEHSLEGAAVFTSVKVYNVAGRLVATLVETEHTPGRYRTDWSAMNDTGSAVASGVYYVKLEIGKRAVTMRMVQLK